MAETATRAFKVLFELQVTALGHEPLFTNPTQLAERMKEWGLQEGSSNVKSHATYLNQIFSRGVRKCTDQLEEKILKAVAKRLQERNADQSVIDLWQSRLHRAIEADNAVKTMPAPLNVEQLTYELFYQSGYASEQFIITPNPAETLKNDHANELRNILLQRLRLNKLPWNGPPKVQAKYRFNFPTRELAQSWWEALVDEVEALTKDKASLRDVIDGISWLDEKDYLSISVIPSEMCAVPVIAFDPNDTIKASAYIFFYHTSMGLDGETTSLLSLAKLDDKAFNTWRTYAYRPIVRGVVQDRDITIDRVRLKEVPAYKKLREISA